MIMTPWAVLYCFFAAVTCLAVQLPPTHILANVVKIGMCIRVAEYFSWLLKENMRLLPTLHSLLFLKTNKMIFTSSSQICYKPFLLLIDAIYASNIFSIISIVATKDYLNRSRQENNKMGDWVQIFERARDLFSTKLFLKWNAFLTSKMHYISANNLQYPYQHLQVMEEEDIPP